MSIKTKAVVAVGYWMVALCAVIAVAWACGR